MTPTPEGAGRRRRFSARPPPGAQSAVSMAVDCERMIEEADPARSIGEFAGVLDRSRFEESVKGKAAGNQLGRGIDPRFAPSEFEWDQAANEAVRPMGKRLAEIRVSEAEGNGAMEGSLTPRKTSAARQAKPFAQNLPHSPERPPAPPESAPHPKDAAGRNSFTASGLRFSLNSTHSSTMRSLKDSNGLRLGLYPCLVPGTLVHRVTRR